MKFKQFFLYVERLSKQGKQVILTFLFLAILVNIVFFEANSDVIIFGLLGLYILASKTYKLNSKTSFLFCLLILAVLFLEFLISGTSFYTEKAAVWLFLFMLIGILQELLFQGKNKKIPQR